MKPITHTVLYFSKILRIFGKYPTRELVVSASERYFERNVAHLLLPDALEMYGTYQELHCTKHPSTGEFIAVKLKVEPDGNLKDIKDCFDKSLQDDMDQHAINEKIYPEIFFRLNPTWKKTAYMTHLYQDAEWNKWICKLVDFSKQGNNKFIYKKTKRVVNQKTLTRDLRALDYLLFQKVSEQIFKQYGIVITQTWFKYHVDENLVKRYGEELSENICKKMELPDTEIEFPKYLLSENELEEAAILLTTKTILF